MARPKKNIGGAYKPKKINIICVMLQVLSMKKMKGGERKDWEVRLKDFKSEFEHQSIIKEQYNEWLEFDKESYRMSQVRFQEHKIEGQKIIQHERKNLEWGVRNYRNL